MNTFNKKSLYTALAGLGVLGATGAAQAVNLNPNGLGQALVYPYYTTRSVGVLDVTTVGNSYNSLLSVVNSTGSAKAVKVRFLEGKNSREVLDFNLFLSPFDVWTTAIIPAGTGLVSSNSVGARIITSDKSCTLPQIPATGVDFVNYAYTGTADDKGGTGVDRTREGYVEIIEMATFASTSTTAKQITHVSGVPPGCASVNDTQAAKDALPLSGGLFGGISLINVNAGTDYSTEAVALDNFYQIGSNYNPAGVVTPDLTQATPPISQVPANNNVYTSTWAAGADPVSAVLMHDNVLNEFVLDAATRSGTDWVVTFPTKRYYVNVGTGNAPRLFQRNFNTTAGSCDDVTLNIYDREETTTTTPNTFSPPPPTPTNSICWEANVITFNGTNVLNSGNVANLPTSFANGWLRLGFPVAAAIPPASAPNALVHTLGNAATSITAINGATTAGNTVTYFGLPVVGFMVQSFTNNTLNVGGVNVLSNYGGDFRHRYTTRIQ